MKKILGFICISINCFTLYSQTAKDCAVEVWAQVVSNPPSITINWPTNTTTTNYAIARKPKTASAWTTIAPTLPGTSNQYVDNTVSTGILYDYRVIRTGSNYTGYGYINSGIEIPEVHDRGKLILLIANTHSLTLASEINRLQNDMEGDGWTVLRHYISPTASVTQVKALIASTYNLDPGNTKALFLLGHIPVPYSGNLNPDGHGDHLGAWPADTYYGELNGVWTDISVTSTTVSPLRTRNQPGDGKFDQSVLPSSMELQVGRVDLWGMTSFTITEQQLLKNYLDKDHNYRKKISTVTNAAVVDDNFGYFSSEAFAANGFKAFAPLVNPTNVITGDYFTSMTGGNGYQWSYGCGGGSFTSAGGIGTTSNFVSSNLQGVFTMLFGSYFGDWDVQNNFLRAPLCQGKTLTSIWAGRPHWALHHMGMGENIGYSTWVTQNNANTYFYNYGNTFVHIALMGDPTLRNNVMSPVSNVVASKIGYDCKITWSASPETNVIGYNVYMKNDSVPNYTKINNTPVSGTTYTDYCLAHQGTYQYMVRALKLETTPSGSYFNMSEGIADTAYNSKSTLVIAAFTSSIAGVTLNATSTSTNSTNYFWDFGNGSTSTSTAVSTTYFSNGSYNVLLVASNVCDVDSVYQQISILEVGLSESQFENNFKVWPNPTSGKIKISFDSNDSADLSLETTEGKKVLSRRGIKSNEDLQLPQLERGMYFLILQVAGKIEIRKLIIE